MLSLMATRLGKMTKNHVKRFSKNREYVVRNRVMDWVKDNHIKITNIATKSLGKGCIEAEVSYEVKDDDR